MAWHRNARCKLQQKVLAVFLTVSRKIALAHEATAIGDDRVDHDRVGMIQGSSGRFAADAATCSSTRDSRILLPINSRHWTLRFLQVRLPTRT